MWKEIPWRLLSVHPQAPHLHPHHESPSFTQNQDYWASPPYGLYSSVPSDLKHSVTKLEAWKLVEWSSVVIFWVSETFSVVTACGSKSQMQKQLNYQTLLSVESVLSRTGTLWSASMGDNGWCNAWDEPVCHRGLRVDDTMLSGSHLVSLSQEGLGIRLGWGEWCWPLWQFSQIVGEVGLELHREVYWKICRSFIKLLRVTF